MNDKKFKLLACQVNIPPMTTVGEKENHLRRLAVEIDTKLANNRHDLVVLPELSSIDYSRQSFDRLSLLAETPDGISAQILGEIAKKHKTAIVFGIPRMENGKYHISQVMVDENGKVGGHFDKLHMAQFGASMEKDYYLPGDHLLTFNVNGLKIAPVICYDIRFPELFRALAMRHGVQLIIHCAAWARDECFFAWHQFVRTRAMENQIFMLTLNRAGKEFGNSLFCYPWMDETRPGIAFSKTEEEFKSIEFDLALMDTVRKDYTFLIDRLDNYNSLSCTLVD